MDEIDVLVVGAGPVGLTAAAELRRHGVDCRIVDRLAAPQHFAKAVGVQPRTMELWDLMGLVGAALDGAVPMRGQLLFADGRPGPRIDLVLPTDIPYGFAALPQYTTERLLTDHLAGYGTRVERGTELLSVQQDADGVRAVLGTASGPQEVRARYVIGCDGAHSLVRKAAGLRFEGDAFPEQYMLGDVEVDWDLPDGYGVRAMHHDAEGRVDDALVCIPLPGRGRYRMSMMVPDELSTDGGPAAAGSGNGGGPAAAGSGNGGSGDGVAHGLEGGRAPELRHIQAVLDRLSPRQPVHASALRWSSTFRISHRLVNSYRAGRLFLAGDAAHIHPPTGAQGMNTGIQDAFNLAWKLALAVRGTGTAGLLDSYDAERRPVGEEVVGRTVRHAREGVPTDAGDLDAVLRREAQLLVGYPDSPLVEPAAGAPDGPGPHGPGPGERAPDCRGLERELANYPVRLFDLLRGPRHTLLFHLGSGTAEEHVTTCAVAALSAAHGLLDVYAVLAPDAPAPQWRLPSVRDGASGFAAAYAARPGEAFLVRPDGYLTGRFHPPTPDRLVDALRRTFGVG
ncbi:FAD-dependent monooxygenase [Kitasatospora sp. RG8]|uniref:FAD-dependent monooxygenase n=1 Tax=Kitasatospora sp. RG8 TaxID=2820815 RepID=UPI001ADF9964|nr:FAD-dependent monooxygenase [Kitasatospora sp. RG8]MBP0451614.1 FAD-dependent monooxygenase [Kitasatospora sp. RG8]